MTFIQSYLKKNLRPIRFHILVAAMIFFAVAVITSVIMRENIDRLIGIINEVAPEFDLEDLEEFAGIENFTGLNAMVFYFLNNSRSFLVTMFGGIVLFFPFLALFVNAALVGIIEPLITAETGIETWAFYLYGILPHGILEIPTFFIAAAVGMKIAKDIVIRPKTAKRTDRLRENFLLGIRLLPLLFIMLFLAAFIEAFITPMIIERFL